MKTIITCIILTAFIFNSLDRQDYALKHGPASASVIDVSFCDLVRQPKLYDRKIVRVKAIYRYGFEWSELYCLGCREAGIIWVELGDSFESNTKKKIASKVKDVGDNGRTVKIVAVGIFYTDGGYGHLGAYKYKYVIDYLEQAEVILNDSPSPYALPKVVLRRAKC